MLHPDTESRPDIAASSDLRTTIPKPSELGSLREPQPAAAQIHVDARLPMPGAKTTQSQLKKLIEQGEQMNEKLEDIARSVNGEGRKGQSQDQAEADPQDSSEA